MKVRTTPAQRFLAGPLLAEVDDDARIALFQALKEGSAPAGTTLIEQGKPCDRLWFLIDGAASIVRSDRDGGELIIGRLEAPGIFGATSFFRPSPPTVSIRAATDVVVMTLSHRGHARLRRDQPRAAEALALATVRVLAERFDLLDSRMAEFMAAHDDQPKVNEWAGFRARLFEESNVF